MAALRTRAGGRIRLLLGVDALLAECVPAHGKQLSHPVEMVELLRTIVALNEKGFHDLKERIDFIVFIINNLKI